MKIARIRVFPTPWNDCRDCGATGQIARVARVRMRHNQGVLRSFQSVEIGTCPRCDGRGRRFAGLAGALIELAYAAVRPYAVAFRALKMPARPVVIRSLDDERPPPSRWRRVRVYWRGARAESKQQIRLIAADFRRDTDPAAL